MTLSLCGCRGELSVGRNFLRTLHRRLFGDVWKWAGNVRTTRHLGVEYWLIATEWRTLLDDARRWMAHQTYPADETAARFQHKLVWIHPVSKR